MRGDLKEEDQQPEIEFWEEFYLDAFQELSSCRSSGGMAVGPIPFTSIVEYSKIFNVEDFEEFHHIIRRMDDTLIGLQVKKSKSATEKKSKAGK